MKVAELKIGMMLEPAGDSEIFLKLPPLSEQMAYLTVKCANPTFFRNGQAPRLAMYLGNRKDVSVNKKQMGWSDRFVLVDNEVTAVDPSAWRRMKPVE